VLSCNSGPSVFSSLQASKHIFSELFSQVRLRELSPAILFLSFGLLNPSIVATV